MYLVVHDGRAILLHHQVVERFQVQGCGANQVGLGCLVEGVSAVHHGHGLAQVPIALQRTQQTHVTRHSTQAKHRGPHLRSQRSTSKALAWSTGGP